MSGPALWRYGQALPLKSRLLGLLRRYRDPKSFNCLGGVRTLSCQEKMYRVVASSNPSCWLGPCVGYCQLHMTFRGLVRYGFLEDAQELCERTITLFGQDVLRFGSMHEYYSPDDGEPLLNLGFRTGTCWC